MFPQISIIIPVYNASRSIVTCCESLFKQTLASLEFVFVDDASTDDSLEKIRQTLDCYPERVNQVLFLRHKEHLGVGAARQHGLEVATGDYIIHCDSDDWVDSLMYEQLYCRAVTSAADIVTCGYVVESAQGNCLFQVPALSIESEIIPFSISPQTGALWNKLVRRQLIQEYQLKIPDNINWGEDLCFSIQALLLSSKTEKVDSPFYHYVQQENSLTHGIRFSLVQDLLQCAQVIESFLQVHKLSLKYELQLNWLKFQLKQYYLIFPETRSFSLWINTYPECHKSVWGYSSPFYLKVISWLITHGQLFFAERLLTIKDGLSRR